MAQDLVEGTIVTQDRKSRTARLQAMISSQEVEVLASDAAMDVLRVEVLRPSKGLWRFVGEKRLRRSVPPQYW